MTLFVYIRKAKRAKTVSATNIASNNRIPLPRSKLWITQHAHERARHHQVVHLVFVRCIDPSTIQAVYIWFLWNTFPAQRNVSYSSPVPFPFLILFPLFSALGRSIAVQFLLHRVRSLSESFVWHRLWWIESGQGSPPRTLRGVKTNNDCISSAKRVPMTVVPDKPSSLTLPICLGSLVSDKSRENRETVVNPWRRN